MVEGAYTKLCVTFFLNAFEDKILYIYIGLQWLKQKTLSKKNYVHV